MKVEFGRSWGWSEAEHVRVSMRSGKFALYIQVHVVGRMMEGRGDIAREQSENPSRT